MENLIKDTIYTQKVYLLVDENEQKVTVYYDKQKAYNRLKRELVSLEGIECFREYEYKVNDSDIKDMADDVNMFLTIKNIKFNC